MFVSNVQVQCFGWKWLNRACLSVKTLSCYVFCMKSEHLLPSHVFADNACLSVWNDQIPSFGIKMAVLAWNVIQSDVFLCFLLKSHMPISWKCPNCSKMVISLSKCPKMAVFAWNVMFFFGFFLLEMPIFAQISNFFAQNATFGLKFYLKRAFFVMFLWKFSPKRLFLLKCQIFLLEMHFLPEMWCFCLFSLFPLLNFFFFLAENDLFGLKFLEKRAFIVMLF